jgi:hypothetical protein
LHKLLKTILCAEYVECTVTGYVTGATAICAEYVECTVTGNVTGATAICVKYVECTATGYVTGAPYCQLCEGRGIFCISETTVMCEI